MKITKSTALAAQFPNSKSLDQVSPGTMLVDKDGDAVLKMDDDHYCILCAGGALLSSPAGLDFPLRLPRPGETFTLSAE